MKNKKHIVSIAEIATLIGSVGCWVMVAYKFLMMMCAAATSELATLDTSAATLAVWVFVAALLSIIHDRIDTYKCDLDDEDNDEFYDEEV